MKQVPRILVALTLGAASYLFTDQATVGLLAAAVSFWLLGQRHSSRAHGYKTHSYKTHGYEKNPGGALPPRHAAARPDLGGGVEVVCKQVTPLRQEWVSVKTGRLYDVLSQHGPQNAQPGDHGRVTMGPAGYRIKPSAKPLAKTE